METAGTAANGGERKEKPWLAHYPWRVPAGCEYPPGNVAKLAEAWADKKPGAKLIFPGAVWSLGRLLRHCRSLARGIAELGVGKGDRVAILLPDCPQAFVAFYGALLAEAVVVPLSERSPEEEDVRRLDETGARLLIATEESLLRKPALRTVAGLTAIVATTPSDGLARPLGIAVPSAARLILRGEVAELYRLPSVRRWRRLLRHADSELVRKNAVSPEEGGELAVIRYRSSESGAARAAALTHANLIAGAIQYASWHYDDEGAGTAWLAELAAPGRCGGRGMYAPAESAGPVLARPANRGGSGEGWLLPLPDNDVRIVGPDSMAPLGPGEIGELAAKGPQTSTGYWSRTGPSAELRENGWLRTGELASMDEEGRVVLAGRLSERIRTAAGDVYPGRVERVLLAHPAVGEARVRGARNALGEMETVAHVMLREGSSASAAQLRRWALERLLPHEAPARIVVRPAALPLPAAE